MVLCDFAGVGPMVTSVEFDSLRDRNFGFEALVEPLAAEPLLRQIARYDADDAARVRDLIRDRAGLDRTVERLVAIYEEVLSEDRSAPIAHRGLRLDRWAWRERFLLRLHWAWMSVPRRQRERIKRLPGFRRVLGGVRRLL